MQYRYLQQKKGVSKKKQKKKLQIVATFFFFFLTPPNICAVTFLISAVRVSLRGDIKAQKQDLPFIYKFLNALRSGHIEHVALLYRNLKKKTYCSGLDGSHYSTTSYKGQGYGGGGEQ